MKDKIFYHIDGVNINIYQIVEWSKYTDRVEICLSNNTVFCIYRDCDTTGYDIFTKALIDMTV